MRDLIIEKEDVSEDIAKNYHKINKRKIFSRFGEIEVNIEKAILFEKGLIGVIEKANFCLANFPGADFSNFKILQALDNSDISFIVMALGSAENALNYISKKDIDICLENLVIRHTEAIFLLVISIHHKKDSDGRKYIQLSANVRAPIILDVIKLRGFQYVFDNNEYPIQYIISQH